MILACVIIWQPPNQPLITAVTHVPRLLIESLQRPLHWIPRHCAWSDRRFIRHIWPMHWVCQGTLPTLTTSSHTYTHKQLHTRHSAMLFQWFASMISLAFLIHRRLRHVRQSIQGCGLYWGTCQGFRATCFGNKGAHDRLSRMRSSSQRKITARQVKPS